MSEEIKEQQSAPAATGESQPREISVPESVSAQPTKANPELALIGQEISGCVILEKISSGGMGTVFKAKHKALERIVCVKILSPSLANDKKAVGLFLTEARAIAEIDHPNIVFVYNVGREKSFYFIVMGFIEGESLSSIVRKKPNLPISFIIDTFIGILRGLEAAHQKGIIHRDIKPSNILINKKLEPKIVDFGIAKKVDKDKGCTKTTELAGTAYFLSPEQALGRAIDTRADLYSVGASLFYVLTGKYPFTGKNSMDIIQKHINEPVPDVAGLRRGIPPWLAAAVSKLMAKDPAERFQTATETLLYFQKMRADDQLKVSQGVNIADEIGLKISGENPDSAAAKEETRNNRFNMDTTQRTPSISRASLPGVHSLGGKPSAHAARQSLRPRPVQHSTASIPPLGMAPTKRPGLGGAVASSSLTKNIIFTLLAGLMLITSAALMLKLGGICSAYDIADKTFSQALVAPWVAETYQPGQILWACAAFIFIIFCFSMLFFNRLSKAAPVALLIAVVSYLAAFYGYAPAEIDNWLAPTFLPMYAFIFGALGIKVDDSDYYPVYMRFVGSAFFFLAFYCVFLFFRPEGFQSGLLTQSLFYSTMALMAAAFGLQFLRGSIMYRFTTLILFVAACASIWVYQTSGNVYYTLSQIERASSVAAEPAPAAPANIAELRAAFIENQSRLAPSSTRAEIERAVWAFTLKEPAENFKYNFKQQGFVYFAIIALIIYGVLMFIINLFEKRDNRWILT